MLEINFLDWHEGSTVSYIICDRWWHLKIVVFKYHEGWACVKIEVDVVWLIYRPEILPWYLKHKPNDNNTKQHVYTVSQKSSKPNSWQ